MATALHVAKDVDQTTTIEMSNGPGKKPNAFNLYTIAGGHYRKSPAADLAVFDLIGIKEKDKPLFTNRFITPSALKGDSAKPLSRDLEMTIVGFPSGLGHDADGSLVPLSFRSHVASDFFSLADPDFSTKLIVYCLENGTVGGYSGAPVFSLSPDSNGLYGFIKGNVNDDQGGKIAVATPACFINSLI